MDLKDSLSRNDWNKSVLITERQPKRLLKRHRRGIPKWDGMVRERMPPAYAVAISYEKGENLFMCVVFKLNYKYK